MTRVHAIRTADGLMLHAKERGEGESMLLCNGLFCTDQYYVRWWQHFSRTHRLVSFDYRSHGESDDDPDPHNVTISRLVDDAAQVQRSLCPEPSIIVGHSMGVRIALELYHRAPRQVRALILLCGSAYDSLGKLGHFSALPKSLGRVLKLADHLEPSPSFIKSFIVRTDMVSKSAYLVGGMSKELTPRAPIDRLLKHLERMDTRVMSNLARSYLNHSSRHILARVEVPVLLLIGEKDALAPPSHGKQVAKQLPHADFHVVDGTTHLAPIEKPGLVHDLVEEFLHQRLPSP